MHYLCLLPLLFAFVLPANAQDNACTGGVVWVDSNGNGQRDDGEKGLSGVKVSDGRRVVVTDAHGQYDLPLPAGEGRTLFVIKPPGYDFPARSDGLPSFWINDPPSLQPKLKYGGIPISAHGVPRCMGFPLLRQKTRRDKGELEVLLFADTQTKSVADIGYYRRDIVEPLAGKHAATLGLTLGDVVNDDLSLYPALNEVTRQLGVPWLHIAGNHDLDFDAARDEDSLLTFRNTYGPDTFAWEEREAVFVGLDDVIHQPGQKPSYIGGLREDQFAFLEAYLPTVPKDRLLVLGVHIPFFDAKPDTETFRHADRARLFALLKDFPHVLLLSGHSHTQQHVYHGADSGWHGSAPLHEYNVGAVCGAFWSGVKDAQGIPDATMADGTPNGYASLQLRAAGAYSLAWHPARDPGRALSLYAPKVLRRGAYPAFAIYANVFMGQDDSKVEYRVDAGQWKPMSQVRQPDPGLLAENIRDDSADALRGYDRSPEAVPSRHLWRGALPTELTVGEHRVEVRLQDQGRGEQTATTIYRLQEAVE
ncbi:calcineurin-like phosphoesterase family protein [Pseudoxanthomonas sp. CF125]|uniref:calcineurin-like phosphoesterase C-terminal domain-containing protein n=1 Tax=Pseudoxanthomonas sp. CF125 TaxID=1855303 RepID=UPI0008913BEC|nr:calcineurin-like phosphoesterase family protein [Pseudoxanthomonas sp. CF125]SDQ25061.1 Calcineurin-like phosphoesterase [Pseudoxanthomonas sp. CF125]